MIFLQPLMALETPMISNRPSFTTSTYTVQPRDITLEMGYQYSFNYNSIGTNTSTTPLLDLRTGLTPNMEINLLWGGWNINRTDNQASQSTTSDVSVGSKYRLVKSDVYNLTLLGIVSFPTGSSSAISSQVDPTIGILWDRTLTSKISAFGTFQTTSFSTQDQRVYDLQPALGISFAMKSALAAFIEYYSCIPLRADGIFQHAFDAGLTYLINNDLQWDINFAVGLNSQSDSYVGSGIAFRF